MPVYEYACTSCGERTEAKQGFHDAPLEECPICGGKLRKLYSPVGIVFRGSGFYSTDARKSKATSGSNDDKPAKSQQEKKTDASASSSKESKSSDSSSGSSSSSKESNREKSA